MRLKYHLSEYLPGLFRATANLYGVVGYPDNTYKISISCDCRKCFNIDQIDAKVKAGIRSKLYNDNKRDPRIPSATGMSILWDEDRSEMKTFSIKKEQAVDYRDCVYEVTKVSDVWTVIKHDAPLLTYNEATELLFKQLTKGECNE